MYSFVEKVFQSFRCREEEGDNCGIVEWEEQVAVVVDDGMSSSYGIVAVVVAVDDNTFA